MKLLLADRWMDRKKLWGQYKRGREGKRKVCCQQGSQVNQEKKHKLKKAKEREGQTGRRGRQWQSMKNESMMANEWNERQKNWGDDKSRMIKNHIWKNREKKKRVCLSVFAGLRVGQDFQGCWAAAVLHHSTQSVTSWWHRDTQTYLTFYLCEDF